jgi:HK97 family phage major capsid protein
MSTVKSPSSQQIAAQRIAPGGHLSRTTETRSWAEQFVASRAWANVEFAGTHDQTLAHGEVEARALPHTLASLDGALPASPIHNLTAVPPPSGLLPLVTVIPVETNGIDYLKWAKKAGGAEVVAEGQAKPTGEWELTVVPAQLDTIAARTSFTRQLAEDGPALVAYLNQELQGEVTRKVEAEAVAALAAATLPATTGPAGTGLSGAIRQGKAVVQAAGYSANAFLIHNDDLVDLDLASSAEFRGDTYWGMTPVVDPGAVRGTVTVGDFKAGVAHYRRTTVKLFVTDSHAGNFGFNVLDAIAEQRCKTVVVRPAALVKATAGAAARSSKPLTKAA